MGRFERRKKSNLFKIILFQQPVLLGKGIIPNRNMTAGLAGRIKCTTRASDGA
jgi:hypothetical protein